MQGRKAKPPRLWFRSGRDGTGTWVILDRGRQIRTGCGAADVEGATLALQAHLATRHQPTIGARDPAALALADVLVAYVDAADPGPSAEANQRRRFDELCGRVDRLLEWWGDKRLSEVKAQACREYVVWRVAQPRRHAKTAEAKARPISTETARRELEDLAAAISAYHAEHSLTVVPVVTLPERMPSRDRWLTRNEAARLLGAALGFVWDSAAARWKKQRRDRVTRVRRRHAARFILIGLYSGRREETIRRTQWHPNPGAPWLDLDAWVYHGRGRDERETKKRRPAAKVAHRLRPHLERWRHMDAALSAARRAAGVPASEAEVRHVVHRPDGSPLIGKIKTAWSGILSDAGLGPDVVRHVLRHTAATWCMQAGTDLWAASGFLAMTVETLQDTYGHHHPDFQEEAARAFSGQRRTDSRREG